MWIILMLIVRPYLNISKISDTAYRLSEAGAKKKIIAWLGQ